MCMIDGRIYILVFCVATRTKQEYSGGFLSLFLVQHIMPLSRERWKKRWYLVKVVVPLLKQWNSIYSSNFIFLFYLLVTWNDTKFREFSENMHELKCLFSTIFCSLGSVKHHSQKTPYGRHLLSPCWDVPLHSSFFPSPTPRTFRSFFYSTNERLCNRRMWVFYHKYKCRLLLHHKVR